MRLVLASTSSRRCDLLALLGAPFETIAPPFHEVVREGISASAQACEFARGKARAVAALHPDAAVLGSDTLIEVDDRVLGKPQCIQDARLILAELCGRMHRIRTAVSIIHVAAGFEETALATVEVWMRRWMEPEAEEYLATGEGLDKAGGYAIQGQGARLIERIVGDYTAAVGLPLRTVADALVRVGCTVPVDVDDLYRRRPYANWSRFTALTDAHH